MKKIPIPSLINWMWNMGFILSMSITIQSITGMFISMNYINMNNPFNNNMEIFLNNNWGWTMRIIHMNTPSMIFITILLHMMRNLMFKSFMNKMMWNSGFTLLMMMMMCSFMGYTLPWSQMSYWGMMVITNTISILPLIGKPLMFLIWGNFNINITTLNRMFIMHFLIPIMIFMMMIIHINILHKKLSFNQLGISNKIDLINLNSYMIIKDFYMLMLIWMMFMNLMLTKPMILNNPDNFVMMNNIITPSNIEPEWYFMLFYSMLRLINNKMGGLFISMFMIITIFMMPKMMKNKFQSIKFYPINKILMTLILNLMIMISMMGFKNMENPFMLLNMIMIKLMFMMFPMMMLMNKIQDFL